MSIIVILDESGSMGSMGSEPVESINSLIDEQRKINPDAHFSLYTFNGVSSVKIEKTLKEVEKFTSYNPSGFTALYDTVGLVVTNYLKRSDNKNVHLIIVTDGADNCSKEFSANEIKRLLERVKDQEGWKVQFLGANMDCATDAKSIGISNTNYVSYSQNSRGSLCRAMKSASNNISTK